MSQDGRYILSYYVSEQGDDTAMFKDILYLFKKYGEMPEFVSEYLIYFERTKHSLTKEDYHNLMAIQILESINGLKWENVK